MSAHGGEGRCERGLVLPPDRNERVELVAAALCDAEFFPDAWEFTEQLQREAYRSEALDLLVKRDAWAAVQVVDPARVLDVEDEL